MASRLLTVGRKRRSIPSARLLRKSINGGRTIVRLSESSGRFAGNSRKFRSQNAAEPGRGDHNKNCIVRAVHSVGVAGRGLATRSRGENRQKKEAGRREKRVAVRMGRTRVGMKARERADGHSRARSRSGFLSLPSKKNRALEFRTSNPTSRVRPSFHSFRHLLVESAP